MAISPVTMWIKSWQVAVILIYLQNDTPEVFASNERLGCHADLGDCMEGHIVI